MVITDFYIALVSGLFFGLLFSETTGITTGGIIVPSYLALVLDQVEVLLSIFLVAIVTYLIVEYILPKYLVLFGRRRFVATLLVAIILKLLLELAYPIMPFNIFLFRGIGIIVPALISNAFAKQGIKLTVFSTLFVAGIVFAFMTAIHLL